MKPDTRRRFLSSGRISALSAILLLSAILTAFLGSLYMKRCLEQESIAQKNRYELHCLGETLADRSDFLTEQARHFSITGEPEYLYAYWEEVIVLQNRESVIADLSGYNLPPEEQELLTMAKEYSDSLIETERLAMQLILLAEPDKTETLLAEEHDSPYVSHVLSVSLPENCQNQSPEAMQKKAFDLLFDASYHSSKEKIMTPISNFQNAMDERMNTEVAEAVKGQNLAMAVQMVCSVLICLFIVIMAVGFHHLYVKPLKQYTAELESFDLKNRFQKNDYSMIHIKPQGAFELYSFARIFNQLSVILKNELLWHLEAEEKLRAATMEAEHANRAKSDFFAQMSHEFRTPLNAVVGYLYLLRQTELTETQHSYCESISYSSHSLLGLINNILDFSKAESGRLELENTDFSLLEILHETESMMQSSVMHKPVTIEMEIPPDLPEMVKGDPVRLRQVLVNLLGNAVKFTEQGTIILSVKIIADSEDGYTMQFSVQDTGTGIPEHRLKSIFEPFVQVDAGITRKYGGTGLGLPISQMIVQSAGKGNHSIAVTSHPGEGSCFSFCMDFGISAKQAPEPEQNIQPVSRKDIRILLVDDNEINLSMEQTVLFSLGVKADTAGSGAEALRLAQQNIYSMILLDLHMPEMDGYETADRLRQMMHCRNIPIIALTADVISGTEEKIRMHGMNGCLSKPFQVEQLRQTIETGTAPKTEQLPETDTPVFDYRSLLEKLGGDDAKLHELITRFWNRHKHDADYICSHIAAGNMENARPLLHDLIGTSGNLCCDLLCCRAKEIQHQIHSGAQPDTEPLRLAWELTLDAMQEYLHEAAHPEEIEFDMEQAQKVFRTFCQLCREYDITAAEYFQKHFSAFRSILSGQELNRLEEAVTCFDFQTINETYGGMKDVSGITD